MNKKAPVKPVIAEALRWGFLLFSLVALFVLSRVLLVRSVPPFAPPKLKPCGKILFDVNRAKDPVLLSMAVSPCGNVGLLDSKSGVVQVFSAQGEFVLQTPSEFQGIGKILKPLTVAFGDQEEIFVADTGNQRVVQFSPDGLVKTLGGPGVFQGQFVLPTSMTSLHHELFVLDSALCRIQQFGPEGDFRAKSGRKGQGPGSFLLPSSLTHDDDGNLLVIDSRQEAVSKYDSFLNFQNQKKIAFRKKSFALTRAAFAGEGLMFFLSKSSQEILVFYQNTVIAVYTPQDLGLVQALWTDVAGHDNRLYILDGKGMKVDLFEIQ